VTTNLRSCRAFFSAARKFAFTISFLIIVAGGVAAQTNTYPSSGNVGIGTTSPNRKLDVLDTSNPQLRLTHTAGSAYTDFQVVSTGQLVISPSGVDLTMAKPISVAATSDAFRFYYSSDDNKRWGIGTGAGGLFHIFQRGDSWADEGARLTINRVGNVGIGTTTPTEKLHVSGNGKLTGNLTVDGTINAKYQDVAEWVPSTEQLAAGTVVVLDPTKSNRVISSTAAYDTRVAGVISSQPGITLGERGAGKVPVATTGRVQVKVDANRAAIQIGDLLVTSDIPGMAMKSEPVNLGGVQIHRPGTIVGKALEPLAKGKGEILVLLSLQ
jgi:hypothetical protein